jgi:4-hydroxy-3-polyprenylbenzoate decarboxylase
MDGGPFVTMPQVYTEDADKPGIMNANLGMYRIQLAGNDYILNKEIGLHYQLHRGIGVHQTKGQCKRPAFKGEYICRRPAKPPGSGCNAAARRLIRNDLCRGFGQPPFPVFL